MIKNEIVRLTRVFEEIEKNKRLTFKQWCIRELVESYCKKDK